MKDKKITDLINDERKIINDCDLEILESLTKRALSVQKIGHLKEKNTQQVYRPEREIDIIKKILSKSTSKVLNADQITNIYREIISSCRSIEAPLGISFLGPEGSFSHLAVLKQFGKKIKIYPCRSIRQVFEMTEKGIANYGVVPIENSTEGAVNESLDLFIDTSLNIYCELFLPIHHNLITKVKQLKSIVELHSHIHPYGQSRDWIEKNLPMAKLIEAASSTDAVIKIKNKPNAAAIGSSLASSTYKVPILKNHIEDNTNNFTRFVVLARNQQTELTSDDKVSILLSLEDKPGRLSQILNIFSKNNINLKKLESRPSKKKAFDYFFFIDIGGHIKDKKVTKCLEEIKGKSVFFKLLGSYPKGLIHQ